MEWKCIVSSDVENIKPPGQQQKNPKKQQTFYPLRLLSEKNIIHKFDPLNLSFWYFRLITVLW